MAPGARFAFTVQALDDSAGGEDRALGRDLRYHHSTRHIEAAAAAAGLDLLSAGPCVTREDGGAPVPGLVVVLGKAGG
jgi:predicted TPR repeat methyltransferase